jgi:hypothetical protein
MIIFDEPDIAGTVLFLIPFLKSTTLGAAIEKIGSTAVGVLTPRSSHSELAFGVGFAGQSCAAKPFRALELFFDGLLSISRTGVMRAPAGSHPGRLGTRRMRAAQGEDSHRWTALDVNDPDNYDSRLLSLESAAPRARTYADRLSENSREMTLVAETALHGHIR